VNPLNQAGNDEPEFKGLPEMLSSKKKSGAGAKRSQRKIWDKEGRKKRAER